MAQGDHQGRLTIPRRIVITGAHAAGVDAASAAKNDGTAEITLIAKEKRVGIHDAESGLCQEGTYSAENLLIFSTNLLSRDET